MQSQVTANAGRIALASRRQVFAMMGGALLTLAVGAGVGMELGRALERSAAPQPAVAGAWSSSAVARPRVADRHDDAPVVAVAASLPRVADRWYEEPSALPRVADRWYAEHEEQGAREAGLSVPRLLDRGVASESLSIARLKERDAQALQPESPGALIVRREHFASDASAAPGLSIARLKER
jgi:hypothetical protein